MSGTTAQAGIAPGGVMDGLEAAGVMGILEVDTSILRIGRLLLVRAFTGGQWPVTAVQQLAASTLVGPFITAAVSMPAVDFTQVVVSTAEVVSTAAVGLTAAATDNPPLQ